MINEYDKPLSDAEVVELEFIGWQLTQGIHKKQIAFKVIKNFAAMSKAIPVELIPYLDVACDYQLDNPGNAVSNDITESKWSDRVLDIEILRKCGGYTAKDACEAIRTRDGNTYTFGSLKTKRMSHPSKKPDYVDKCIYGYVTEGYDLTDIVKFILGK